MCLEFQIRFKFQLQDSFNSFFSSFWVNMRNHRKEKRRKSSPHSHRITLSEWEVEDDGKRPWLMSYEKHELIQKKKKEKNNMKHGYCCCWWTWWHQKILLFFLFFYLNNAKTVTNHTTCFCGELWLVRGREKL